jgi:D-lactate dehydrogenase (cytochrome)
MDVVVEPGVGWIELNEYLKPYGLFFPLDPGKPPCFLFIKPFNFFINLIKSLL